MSDAWDAAFARARLERVIATGKLEGVELETWRAWGPPPPVRRTAQVRLSSVNGEDRLEVFLNQLSIEVPPPVDCYTMVAPPEVIVSFGERLLALAALPAPDPSRPHDPDVTSISVRDGATLTSRTWNRDLPELAALREEVDRLATLAVKDGNHEVVRIRP